MVEQSEYRQKAIKLAEEAKKKHEEELQREAIFLNHVTLLWWARDKLPQPKGVLWWRKCPLCGAKVKSRALGAMGYYKCTECDYEYAN